MSIVHNVLLQMGLRSQAYRYPMCIVLSNVYLVSLQSLDTVVHVSIHQSHTTTTSQSGQMLGSGGDDMGSHNVTFRPSPLQASQLSLHTQHLKLR